MYGFLRINKQGIDKDSEESYKKLYCGQCCALHKLFGYPWRTMVSYDAAFVGLLILAQQEKQNNDEECWCAIFPKKVNVASPDELPQLFSACLAMLIFSLKISDSLQEKQKLFNIFVTKLCQSRVTKAKTILESLDFPTNSFDHTLKTQQRIETTTRQHIESYAAPSAHLFAEIFQFTATISNRERNKTVLYKIGYHVGKVIYLVDSCIDIIEDIEKEQFNAFLAAYQNHDGGIFERSQNDVVKVIIDSLNHIRALIKDLILVKHQKLIQKILLHDFPQHIHQKINQSIKKLRKHPIVPLKYLPHAALTSALCLFTAQNAEALEWVWDEAVVVPSDCLCFEDENYKLYGFMCRSAQSHSPDSFKCCEVMCNPCLYAFDTSCPICCGCLGQLPKVAVDTFAIGSGIYMIRSRIKEIMGREEREEEQRRYYQQLAEEQIRRQRRAEEERRQQEEKRRKQQREAEQRRKREQFIQNTTKDLRIIENTIRRLVKQLDISFPVDYQTPVLQFIAAHKTEYLLESQKLKQLIATQTSSAQEAQRHLEKANTLYTQASDVYSKVAREVNRAGSSFLIKELEQIDAYLFSPNLKSLLENKKWKEFEEIFTSIIQELEQVRQNAINYQNDDYEEAEETAREAEVLDEEKAYYLLGIQEDATEEQIKTVYRKLVQIYHPDMKNVKNSNRFREIKEAYEYLKRVRGFK